ncbi:oligosaccharide flippase family protein [Actinomycetes bacterium KLBMP 9759]
MVFRIHGAVETVVVGKAFSLDALAQKQYAHRLALLPGNALVQIGSFVLFPAMSRLAAEPARLANAFRRALQWSWIGAIAVAGLTIAVGAPTVVLLFGAGYRDAGLAFVAMAGFGLGVALQASGSEVIKATGRTRLLNWTTAASMTFGIGLLVLLLPLGLVGVGLAVSATELLVGVIVLVLTTRVLAVSAAQLSRVLVPPLLAGAVATAVVTWSGSGAVYGDGRGGAWALLTIAADTSLFVLLFGAGMVLLAPSLVRRAISSVIRHIYRRIAPADGVERRDRELDRPTVVIPVVGTGSDDAVALRAYGNQEWVSPVARTLPMRTIEETHRHDR